MPRNWCSNRLSWKECQDNPARCRKEGSTNWFGYPAHFDLQDFHHQISNGTPGLRWDNVEVTFEPVPCRDNWHGPSWKCECSAIERVVATVAKDGDAHEMEYDSAHSRPIEKVPVSVPSHTEKVVQAPRLPSSAGCAAAYEQCAGRPGWNGPTCCQDGCECRSTGDEFYKQCSPASGGGSCGGAGLASTQLLNDALGPLRETRINTASSPTPATAFTVVLSFFAVLATAAALLVVRLSRPSSTLGGHSLILYAPFQARAGAEEEGA